jgi:hypothetical protein
VVTSEHPITDSEKREALEEVLQSQTFARSAQLRALLRHICERELLGRPEDLTEYQIAIDVLGRRKDASFSEDSSVRNRAYELRQRLDKYYAGERPDASIRIEVPRGGYVPRYIRHQVVETAIVLPPIAVAPVPTPEIHHGDRSWRLVAVAAICLLLGAAGTYLWMRPHPPSVVKEAWGPLADPTGDFVLSVATNLYMLVRPHIAPHARRFPAPPEVYSFYGPNRPLAQGEPLFMEPAQLAVPLGELSAATVICNFRSSLGGGYQILSEAEAPAAALRGRNAVLIGSGTNSHSAATLLRNLPYSIDYTANDRFAVYDRRKPPGQNEVFRAQPVGDPAPAAIYGLLTVIGSFDLLGKPKRTVVLSGAGSAGVQGAAEFFTSASSMADLQRRLAAEGVKGFPATYQVVILCRTSGLRLISYEYVAHAQLN